tara:strand:+ start:677 stop:991 length:315 start_codon:yes stop_codon:yes gene_type:complete
MKKDRVQKLNLKAQEIAKAFSNPNREFNFNKETFTVEFIQPLSEMVAAIYFKKTSGKIALAIAFWKNNKGGHWDYFFPTDSHVLGFRKMEKLLESVEEYNIGKN